MEERILKVRNLMEEEGIDGLLVDSDVNRFYLTGFTGTAGKVLFTGSNNYFITDFRYTEQASDQTEGYEVLEVNQKSEEKIAKILKRDKVKKFGFEAKVVNYNQYIKYRDKLGVELVPTVDLVAQLRMIKDSNELEKIKKAVEITDQAFSHICNFIKPGITEREVALELEYFMKKKGGDKNSFEFIVASGKRSSMPHGVASEKVIETGDFVTMDFGTVYEGYCSDMTRTIIVGEPDEKQKKIYDIVLKAQLEVIDKIKPGMTCKEADALARDIIAEEGYGERFGHSLGHGLGIEVHEFPRVSFASDRVLEPGMVVTDEPGIYIPDWGGVRIEDDLIITEDGCKVLNKSPKELIII